MSPIETIKSDPMFVVKETDSVETAQSLLNEWVHERGYQIATQALFSNDKGTRFTFVFVKLTPSHSRGIAVPEMVIRK